HVLRATKRQRPRGQQRWPAGSGVMRRPLAPPPCRPNPTDPGDAADLSTPQGYQMHRTFPGRFSARQEGVLPSLLITVAEQGTATGMEINRQDGDRTAGIGPYAASGTTRFRPARLAR